MNQDQCTTKKKKFQHLNYQESRIIERQIEKGSSKSEIARVLKRDLSTIKREIKRGTVAQKRTNPYCSKNPDIPDYIVYKKYFADTGQLHYERARRNSGAKCKLGKCIEFIDYAEKMILSDKKWSPDTAVGYAKSKEMFKDIPSTKTMYSWIDKGVCKVKNINLHLKMRRKPRTKAQQGKKC